MDLSQPVEKLGVTYRMHAKKLHKLNIHTIYDLLFYIPSRYDDFSQVTPIKDLEEEQTVSIQATLIKITNQYTRKRGFTIQTARIEDEEGNQADCVWFNQPYITKYLKEGSKISISGKVDSITTRPKISVRDYEVVTDQNKKTVHTARLVPIYPTTRGLSIKWLRNRMSEVLKKHAEDIEDHLPEKLKQKHNLPDLSNAVKTIHFPKTLDEAENAKHRLAFDELFFIQLASLQRKSAWDQKTSTQKLSTKNHEDQIQQFYESLPFTLTGAQNRAIQEILQDINSQKPMNRLLQGDVGAGKTVVAAIALYTAFLNGTQSALMAPTEILANQHYKTLKTLLEPLGAKVALFTSSKKTKQETFDIAVGTHALLNKKLKFDNLSFIVIDEQQRFGVEQRAILREKGKSPHVLTMTATPIPRTVFLTIYQELDLSVLDEMPKGRQKVKTWVVPQEKREAAYDWIKKKVEEGRRYQSPNQAFIICPFIEESENAATVKAAKSEYETLKKSHFSQQKVGLLHGKLKAKEKDQILKDFKEHSYDILIATPVVEVGIDIPDATIMLIEAAERFGLAQLHQLRGRVGRGSKESFCLIFSEEPSHTTLKRLKSLETTHSGAELAEIDLKLRGPGEMYGSKQHGTSNLKIASIADRALVSKTQKEAKEYFDKVENYPLLHNRLKSTIIHKISPD